MAPFREEYLYTLWSMKLKICVKNFLISNDNVTDYFTVLENHPSNFFDVKKEIIQLVITEPPYGHLEKREKDDFDVIVDTEIEAFVKLCANILKPDGHVFIICSREMFWTWYEKFKDFKNDKGEPVFIMPINAETFTNPGCVLIRLTRDVQKNELILLPEADGTPIYVMS